MKATHIIKSSGERCTTMSVSFTVTKQVIIYVIADLKSSNEKVTKKAVEQGIRELFHSDGSEHFAYRDIEDQFGFVPGIEARATATARRLYPDFFQTLHKVQS